MTTIVSDCRRETARNHSNSHLDNFLTDYTAAFARRRRHRPTQTFARQSHCVLRYLFRCWSSNTMFERTRYRINGCDMFKPPVSVFSCGIEFSDVHPQNFREVGPSRFYRDDTEILPIFRKLDANYQLYN